MKQSETLEKEIGVIHKKAVNAVIDNIQRIKKIVADNQEEGDEEDFSEIRLPTAIMYQYIDDQFSEVIASVSTNEKEAIIDDNTSDYRIELSDLNTNVLVKVVEELESLETFEEIEEQLI